MEEDQFFEGYKSPKALFGLPERVRFCNNCVISNQRPSSTVEFLSKSEDSKQTIEFDNNGLCEACRYQSIKQNEINWSRREQALESLLERYRRNDGRYDVIVPGSGGKGNL